MTDHSEAAKAAYPGDSGAAPGIQAWLSGARTGYDRGVADTLAQKLEAEREALARVLYEHATKDYAGFVPKWESAPEYLRGYTQQQADAILASGVIREAGKPVVNVEALAEAMQNASPAQLDHEGSTYKPMYLNWASRLTAPDGPLRDEREVKAEALEEAAKMYTADGGHVTDVMWLTDYIAEIRGV